MALTEIRYVISPTSYAVSPASFRQIARRSLEPREYLPLHHPPDAAVQTPPSSYRPNKTLMATESYSYKQESLAGLQRPPSGQLLSVMQMPS